MGCVHHVEVEDRETFIRGILRVLKPDAWYQLTCFSDRSGPAWNHFTEEQITDYFARKFKFMSLQHSGSVEGDGFTRFFYTVLM